MCGCECHSDSEAPQSNLMNGLMNKNRWFAAHCSASAGFSTAPLSRHSPCTDRVGKCKSLGLCTLLVCNLLLCGWMIRGFCCLFFFRSPANTSAVTCSGPLLCAAAGYNLLPHAPCMHLRVWKVKHINLQMKSSYTANCLHRSVDTVFFFFFSPPRLTWGC